MTKNINKSRFIIKGANTVIRTIKYGLKYIHQIFISATCKDDKINYIVYLCNKYNIILKKVNVNVLNSFMYSNIFHQNVICFIYPIKFYKTINMLKLLNKKSLPLILILDCISDIRNFGAIVRSAFFFGVHFIILSKKNTLSINSDVVKTSSSFIFKVPICLENNLKKTLSLLKDYGIVILSANEKSNNVIYKQNFNVPVAIILGNENKGISKDLLTESSLDFKIPSFNKLNFNKLSLNVSVSCGILLSYINQQRYII